MITKPGNTEIIFMNGERIRLKDLFSIYYPVFASFSGRYITDQVICEDIVQDVFIAFWQKHSHFESLFAMKAFFYKAIRNSCLDHLKHHKVEQKYQDFKKSANEETTFFLDEILRMETYNQVYQEINRLPDMERKVLLLALKERSNKEIASILNIAINTVRTHKARAYKALRKNLGDLLLLFISCRNVNK